jgi:hypothetical protein
MNERVAAELDLIRTAFPDIQVLEESGVCWVRIPRYQVAEGWSATEIEVAFQMPSLLPGQHPYAFWARPALTLAGGAAPGNVSGPVSTPFGDGWLQFSWELDPWHPGAEPQQGTNMLDFVRSFFKRFLERS